VGANVTLAGWVQSVRPMKGSVFVGLRDAYGVTQLVIDKEQLKGQELVTETVIQVKGQVVGRPTEAHNEKLPTGLVEVVTNQVDIMNPAKHPIGIPINRFQNMRASSSKRDKENKASVEARLLHRHLDIRGFNLQRNLRVRAAMVLEARNALSTGAGFVEVETPILFRSTPEGAREFLVPTRSRTPGLFFALVQSPQQYKQLLMAGGVDRYFQVAKCFRDELGRADRQPEFTQLDLEMSFATPEDVKGIVGQVVKAMFLRAASSTREYVAKYLVSEDPSVSNVLPPVLQAAETFFQSDQELETISYDEAMERYGSDKPDRRIGLEIQKIPSDVMKCNVGDGRECLYRAVVIPASLWSPSKKQAEARAAQLVEGTEFAAGVIRLSKVSASWEKLFVKGDADLCKSMVLKENVDREKALSYLNVSPGDHVLLVAGSCDDARYARQVRDSVCGILGQVRLDFATAPEDKQFDMFWVTDFPLYERVEEDGEERIKAVHHPFTSPVPQDEHIVRNFDFTKNGITSEILSVKGQHYDLVCNGWELGGGSVRIHNGDFQEHVMTSVLGIPRESAVAMFGHLLEALRSGCPPHAGLALGIDRMSSIVTGEPSLTDVIAFPKSTKANEPLTGSPSHVPDNVLREYNIQVISNDRNLENN